MKIPTWRLFSAIGQGDTSACRDLLAHGVDVHAMDAVDKDGHTMLHEAAWYGHTDICLMLLEQGASIHAVEEDGWSVLHAAARNGHAHICQILLERGINIDAVEKDGWNALHTATWNGHADVCLLLLDCGSHVLLKNKEGQPALDLAMKNQKHDCANAIRAWVAAKAARAALQEISAAAPPGL